MTISSYQLTGNVPVVGTDGKTRWTGKVRLDDETTNIPALYACGALEPSDSGADAAVADEADSADDTPTE